MTPKSAVNVISLATKDTPAQSLSGFRQLRDGSQRAFRKNSKKPKIVDKRIDQERRPVENYFERIKGARSVSTGYAKTVSMFAAFVTLACSCAWIKLLVE